MRCWNYRRRNEGLVSYREWYRRSGFFFHRLPLVKALESTTHFHPSAADIIVAEFAEVRHILNIAQVHASSKDVRLVTFDADGTLYADGMHFEDDNNMIDKIIQLMELAYTPPSSPRRDIQESLQV